MTSTWSKMPSRWIADRGLRHFTSSEAGVNAAALKLYMALAMFANFKPSPNNPVPGFARLSFSELEDLCDISRRYVASGIRRLELLQIIEIEPISNAHGYRLVGYGDLGWAKLPRSHLLDQNRFRHLGVRGNLHLNALKIYLALATFRSNESREALLSYDKIELYTGMPRPRIRAAIDVLINHDWISLSSYVDGLANKKPPNVYVLRGDFFGKRNRTYARAAMRGAGELAAVGFDDLDSDATFQE